MAQSCRAYVEKVIGRALTKEEAAYVSRNVLKVKARIASANGNPAQIAAIMQQAQGRGAGILARAQRDAALQWRARTEFDAARSIPFAQDNPAQWMKGFFRGNWMKYEGAQNSLGKSVMREGNARADGLEAELYKYGLHDFADSQNMAVKTQINNALWELRKGTALPQVIQQFGKDAANTADIFNRHDEILRTDLNRAGAWIGQNSDRTFRRTFDGNKIARAGGNQYGSQAARDAWAQEQSARMNWNEAFDGQYAQATPAERLKVLEKDFGEHVSGEHIDFSKTYGQGGGGRAGQRFSYQRKYVFNSPADDLAFNEQYGRGSSFLENKVNEQRDGGKAFALMDRLGARPEETLREGNKRWVAELNDTDPGKAKALQDAFDSEMGNTWRLLTGQVGHPNDNFVARLLASARHTIGVAKTGLSIFSLPNDMALRGAMLAQYSGGRLSGSVMKQLAQFTHAAAALPKDEARWLMSQLGSRWEDSTRPIDPNLVDHPGFGALYKFNGYVAKSYGHSWWDNNFRTSQMANDGNIFAREQHLPWDKATFQDGMTRFGIGQKEWDILRTMSTSKLADGRDVLMPQHIKDAPLSSFASLVSVPNPSNSLLAHARDTLAASYRNMLGEMADRGTSAASLENQAAMGMGTLNVDSPYAETMRWLMQLKGWGMNYIRNHLDRELRGSYQNYTTVGQAMRDMMLGRNNRAILGIGRMITKGMAIAYVTNALKDLATGQTPADPFDFETNRETGTLAGTPGGQAAMRAFGKQGLGLYSDWLMQSFAPGESLKDRIVELGGPLPETVLDAGDLAFKAGRQAFKPDGMTDEQAGRNEQQLYSLGWRLIPGTEAWYDKAAFDSLIYNNISETVNPGFKDRLQKRAQERGQGYWNGP